VSKFSKDRRAATAVMMAVSCLALTILFAAGVDLSRIYMVRGRLQTALDATALLAAREMTSDSRNADASSIFWANFAVAHVATGVGVFGATTVGPTFTVVDDNTISVQATVYVNLVFGQLLGQNSLTMAEHAQAVRSTTGLELAMVLDNTGSLGTSGMAAVRQGATNLVNTIYGDSDTIKNLWVSVVPFTSSVNMGTAESSSWWAPSSPPSSAWLNKSWRGCVMARHTNSHDSDDAPPSPSDSTTQFVKFLYPSTYHVYYTTTTTTSHGHQTTTTTYLKGDNDWTPTNITEDQEASYFNSSVGPNLGCDFEPVLPLTASKATILDTISDMPLTPRGGTFINLGLQAGWFTISPRWRGMWANSPSQLPLDYNTANMRKAIVLMTDGNNAWNSVSSGYPDQSGDTDDTAYGRVSDHVLGSSVTESNATSMINSLMLQMCTNIKAQGIVIYTIIYNHSSVSSSTQSLFQRCASSAANYYVAPSESQLEAAFSDIGGQLSAVRVSQ